jgi:hypothetical protein
VNYAQTQIIPEALIIKSFRDNKGKEEQNADL